MFDLDQWVAGSAGVSAAFDQTEAACPPADSGSQGTRFAIYIFQGGAGLTPLLHAGAAVSQPRC